MRRRDVVKLILASLAFDPLAAKAQRAIPVIGALSPAARPAQFETSPYVGFLQGMRELGYVEGKDYLIEWRFAGGDYARLPELANELIASKVNILFATSTASILAAHKATTSIPIVMGYYEDDPTAERDLVSSLAHPAGNVTGLAAMGLQIVSKHLEFIRAILPGLSHLGVLVNPTLASYRSAVPTVRTSAESVGITVLDWEAHTPQEIETAFNAMGQANLGAILLITDAFWFVNRWRIAELSLTNRLPLIVVGPREYVLVGALMSYGASVFELFHRAATYVDKILKGAKAGDLPVEQPIKFDFFINLKTAKTLGLDIPDKLLALADEVIE
jgi:putative tryptophan/tyrosine transport system substrate-binding protein